MVREFVGINREAVLGLAPRLLYHIEVNEQSTLRIKRLKELLTREPELNFIIYFNHISYDDPLLSANMAMRIIPESQKRSRHLVAPVSFSHTDPDNPKNRDFIRMVNIANHCGIETIRVIQAYQVNNPDYGYTEDEAKQTYRNFYDHLKKMRESKTPTGCLISPEGHRSETGILGKAEKSGTISVGRLLAPVIYIPLGIKYPETYDRDHINSGRHVSLKLGETLFQDEPRNYPDFDLLMKNLAETLPKALRGKWRS